MPFRICKICKQTTENFLKFEKDGYKFSECCNCNVRSINPFPSQRTLRNHYIAREKLGNYKKTNAKYRKKSLEHVFRVLCCKTNITYKKNLSILDIGCFDGAFLNFAKKRGWQTFGIELMKEAGRSAARNHNVFIGRLEDYSSKKKYDVITAIGLIEHLQEPMQFFKIIKKNLKNGGIVLIQTPNYESILCKILGKYWFCYSAPEHTFYFSRRSLKKIMISLGFHPLRFISHVKSLRCDYVFYQLQFWGKEIRAFLKPLYNTFPKCIKHAILPFYGGEMIYIFMKSAKT